MLALRPSRRRRLLRVVAIGAATALLHGQLALAHTPVAGAEKKYASSISLSYNWGASTYPNWFRTSLTTALESDWPARAFNNSATPTFVYNSSGAGTVLYGQPMDIPACDPQSEWIGCSTGWGSATWKIWLRDFSRYPRGSWGWIDSGSCGTCFDARRVALHEIEHVTLAVANHDSQGETNTIMSSSTPSSPNQGWNTHHIQRCDEAAAQLLYDVADSAGVYAGCFDHVLHHGTSGLVTTASVGATSYWACVNSGVTVSGRLAVATDSAYQALSNNPLTGRTLWFDRRPVGGSWTTDVTSTTATSASGNNWAKTFSSASAVTYEFRGHYKGETGLDPDYTPTFSITWSTAC
jgi:hypothetical protein